VKDFDLYQAISNCSDLLEKFGGHKYAAGLTLDPSNLVAFQERFEQVVAKSMTEEMQTPVIEIDAVLKFDTITPKFFAVLKQMAPFGPENLKPLFESRNVMVMDSLASFKDRHLRFVASQDGQHNVFNAIGFDLMEHYDFLLKGNPFRLVYTIEENIFNGNTSLQLRIRDIKPE
jgi:Single-stranded DNA-specific exonuclease